MRCVRGGQAPAWRVVGQAFQTSGLWIRPEGAGFIGGIQPPPDYEAGADGDFEPEYALLEDPCWPSPAARATAFTFGRVLPPGDDLTSNVRLVVLDDDRLPRTLGNISRASHAGINCVSLLWCPRSWFGR